MTNLQMKKNKLEVQMFGSFQIKSEKGILDEDKIRSEMVTKLLAYLFSKRKKAVSVSELTDALWQEEDSENPAGALKNLMYRLRTLMKKEWGEGDYIVTGQGSYSWNPELSISVDAEQFEDLKNKAKNEKEEGKKAELYLKAIALYKGPLLSKFSSEFWIAPLSTYYHTMYTSMVKQVSEILLGQQRYDEVFDICSKAVEQDALDEHLHYCIIKALIGQNKPKTAIDYYKTATDLLYDRLGVQPSRQLQDVYKDLLKAQNEQELNLNIIQKELKQEEERAGAFYCEYGVFKEIYLLEVRRASRAGMSIHIALLTLTPPSFIKKGSEAYLNTLSQEMKVMKRVLMEALRSGDVVAKYSGNQFIVMLPMCSFESAKMVTERISVRFLEGNRKRKADLQHSIREIQLQDEE